MERRLTSRGEDRRRQLMDLAAQRFAEQGYDGTSVAEIVEALGVGKGVFYWYFDSKEQLLEELLREAQHDLRRVQNDAVAGADDPLGRIEAAVRSSMTWLGEHRHLFALVQMAGGDARFRDAVRAGQAKSVGDLARHVHDAMAAGCIPPGDPEIVTQAVLGVVNQLNRVFLAHGAHADEVTETAVSFCLSGLLGAGRARGANRGDAA